MRSPQVFRSTLEFLDGSLMPQVEARYPRALMDIRRARAMSRASQPPRALAQSLSATPNQPRLFPSHVA